jgi:DNA-binding SARP family transcriptional activator/TolB-like protein
MSFSLKLLGSVRLESPEGPVRGRAAHRRRLAVLALLAVPPGRSLTRERIIALLWPEASAEGGRRLLTEALYILRKEMGDRVVLSAGEDLRLNPEEVACDATLFESTISRGDLEEAVALYGGPFLDGWYVEDAPDFERWTSEERDRLDRMYESAVEALAERCGAEGDWSRAVEWWRLLWARDPHRSRNALGLMDALTAAGDPAAAFRVGEMHVKLVRDEIGVAPDPEVLARMERLRAAPSDGTSDRPARQDRPPQRNPGQEREENPDNEETATTRDRITSHPPEPELSSGESEGSEPPPLNSPPIPPARRWPRAASYVAIAGLAALVGVTIFRTPGSGGAATAEAPSLDPRRIAVLYFDDHSADRSLGWLASGLTESLIHELAQVRTLQVVSRNGVKPYREGKVPLDSIVRALRVGCVVEGSLQQSGDSVRVVVQLVDAGSGTHLGSSQVVRRMGETFALEEALAQEVATLLRRRLGEQVRLRERMEGTASQGARELVMRAEAAREHAARLSSEANPNDAAVARGFLAAADSMLARAEALAPNWVDPLVTRGWIAIEQGELAGGGVDRSRMFSVALEYARRALVLDPSHPRALQLRGTARWKMVAASSEPGLDSLVARAEEDLRQAVSGDATLAGAWSTLSQLLRFRGEFGASYYAIQRALEEDAYFADQDEIRERLFRSAIALGRYAEARDWCRKGREEFPGDYRFVECGLILLTRDTTTPPDPAGAARIVRELDAMDPPEKARLAGNGYAPVYRNMMVAIVLARAGQGDSARAIMARAREQVERDPELRTSFLYDEARLHLLLGDRDRAVSALRSYLGARPFLRQYVARDILFRDLRGDSRFETLVRPRSRG